MWESDYIKIFTGKTTALDLYICMYIYMYIYIYIYIYIYNH